MTPNISALLALSATAFFSNGICMAAQSIVNPASPATESSLPSSTVTYDRPAKPPEVTCGTGELTIVANGSTLGSIFTAVDSCLGFKIVLPEGRETARTYIALGPGPTRAVLEALLASSDYDYVLRAFASNPGKIESVVLMARSTDSPGVQGTQVPEELVMTPARAAWVESLKANRHSSGAGDEGTASVPDASTSGEKTEPDEASKQRIDETPDEKRSAVPVLTPTDSSQASNNPAARPQKPAETPNEDPAAADSNSVPALSKEVQTKITSMEELFEQRKQMMESQASAPKPQ